MPRDMRSLGKEVALFRGESDELAGKLFDRMDAVRLRRDAALTKTHAHIATEEHAVGEIENFVADLERSNGGPPLDESQKGSPDGEPQKSWGGQK